MEIPIIIIRRLWYRLVIIFIMGIAKKTLSLYGDTLHGGVYAKICWKKGAAAVAPVKYKRVIQRT